MPNDYDLYHFRKWIDDLRLMPPGHPKHEWADVLDRYAKSWGEELAQCNENVIGLRAALKGRNEIIRRHLVELAQCNENVIGLRAALKRLYEDILYSSVPPCE